MSTVTKQPILHSGATLSVLLHDDTCAVHPCGVLQTLDVYARYRQAVSSSTKVHARADLHFLLDMT